MPWGEKWSGGVQALVVVDGTTLLRAEFEQGGEDYSVQATVHVGSRVDFLIGPNPSIGVTKFTASILGPPLSRLRRRGAGAKSYG